MRVPEFIASLYLLDLTPRASRKVRHGVGPSPFRYDFVNLFAIRITGSVKPFSMGTSIRSTSLYPCAEYNATPVSVEAISIS
jgi:hypothetical protein